MAVFDGAAARRAALVVVTGEPGVGKSALCSQLAAAAKAREGIADSNLVTAKKTAADLTAMLKKEE